jgi:DNA-binding NarL/FixJ family response regulator
MLDKPVEQTSNEESVVPGPHRESPPRLAVSSHRESVGLVLADRYPIVLRGLEETFRKEPGLRVLASCTDGEQVVPAIQRHRPDILMLDPQLCRQNGLRVLVHQIEVERLSTRVVLLAGSLDERETIEATRLGVKGLLLKDMSPHLMLQCIRKVHGGGTWLERRSTERAFATMLAREASVRDVARLLTRRELDIFYMVSSGLRNKQVAERLKISDGTVKIHLHNIYQKLRLNGRVQLVLYARRQEII